MHTSTPNCSILKKIIVQVCSRVCMLLATCILCSLQGFYGVYGSVFRRIADEEAQYMDEEEADPLPLFGKQIRYPSMNTLKCYSMQ